MLHRIKGRATKCGPSAISAIAGIHTHDAAAIIRRLFDRKTINGVYMDELAAALIELGWHPEYALRHRNLNKRRHARRQDTYDRIFADVPSETRSVTIGRVLDVWPSGTWAIATTTHLIVSGAGETPSYQLDGGLKLQGRSSSMRLLGWPAAIFSSVSLIQA